MKIQGQGIRPSQFILVYGVGAIVEAPGGPRVIPSFWRWGKRLEGKLNDPNFVIQEDSASALLHGSGIFKIPTNSSFTDMTDSDILFPTVRFPMWALCLKHKKLYYLDSQDQTRCAECIRLQPSLGPGRIYRHEAIRFVRACANGHMDDIPWDHHVHGSSGCKNRIFEWDGGHSSLENVKIKCHLCKSEVSLKDVYNNTSTCSRYLPEEEKYDNDCGEEMKVMLRSQSSLRIPSLVTVITIPPRDSNAYLILSSMGIKPTLARKKPSDWTKTELVSELRQIHSNAPEIVTAQQLERVEEFNEEDIADAIIRVMNTNQTQTTVEEVMTAELGALKHGAEHGAPPVSMKGKTQFEMDVHAVRRVAVAGGLLRIAPVQRLRTVIVQTGYMRTTADMTRARVVPTYLRKNQTTWFPGIELRGEGLFFDFPDNHSTVVGENSKPWMKKFMEDPVKNKRFHPAFVWWHTFSHAVINTLSIDSGYSAASIRERVYFESSPDGQNTRGGVLLYTSQPSGDGTLGGLISLANNFGRMVSLVREKMHNCSNDPLCSSRVLEKNRTNGAACYACLMLSETSCENSNSLLDRNLLVGTI